MSIFTESILHTSSDKEIKTLVREFTTGMISMPAVQRRPQNLDLETKNLVKSDNRDNDGWSLEFKEDFIFSIIKGVNIPSITLMEEEDGRSKLYDGGHRCRCLTQFMRNCFGVQIGQTYFMYKEPLEDPDVRLILKRSSSECTNYTEITSCSVFSDSDRRKFDKKTIKIINYINCLEPIMIDIYNKLNNQASLSPGEKIYAGPHKVHEFLREIRRDYLARFQQSIEMRSLHRYPDMNISGGLFNLLCIPGGNPEPKSTISSLLKFNSSRWGYEFPVEKQDMYKSILDDLFNIIDKCLEIRNGESMETIGFDVTKEKVKPYLVYTLGVIYLKKYDSSAPGFGDIDNIMEDMDVETFARHLLAFSQTGITNEHMKLFQKNTRTPSSIVETDNTTELQGVSNANKPQSTKERAMAIIGYIQSQTDA